MLINFPSHGMLKSDYKVSDNKNKKQFLSAIFAYGIAF